jgi:hypothetical protein
MKEYAITDFATKEARELFRVRNSFSFRIGIRMKKALTSPIGFIGFPIFLLFEVLKRTKKTPSGYRLNNSSITIIGIDKSGDHWSSIAMELASQLLMIDSDLTISTLSTNEIVSQDLIGRNSNYRLPSPRNITNGSRNWNNMCERMLSTMLYNHCSGVVIYLGDLLYSGIKKSLNHVPENINLLLLNNLIEVPLGEKWSANALVLNLSSSINNLSFNENEKISEEKIHSNNLNFFAFVPDEVVLRNTVEKVLEEFSPPHYEKEVIVLGEKYVNTTLNNNSSTILIISDHINNIKEINSIRCPTILLRTSRKIPASILVLIRKMEKSGSLLVLRNPDEDKLLELIKYISDVRTRSYMMKAIQQKVTISYNQLDNVFKILNSIKS